MLLNLDYQIKVRLIVLQQGFNLQKFPVYQLN